MIQRLRIRIAQWILGRHCACYQIGYHTMVDTEQWVKAKKDERRKRIGQSSN